ncbi:MAG: polysaccharide deacetylase family protein [Candidatus Altimarinota bacterium]
MKKANLIPLALFCIVFLAYSVYFVKVINTSEHLEPNSIAKNVQRVLDQRSLEAGKNGDQMALPSESLLKEPVTRYVNYTWLNVRKEPSLASSVVEKIVKNDQVQVIGYPSSSWAHIRTNAGTKGYVARRYLSDAPLQEDKPIAAVPTPAVPKAPEAPTIPTPPPAAPVEQTPAPAASATVIYDVPVITYHHVSDDVENYSRNLVLPEINFNAQLDYLVANGFKTYTFFDLQAVTSGKKNADPKAVILTFNGGYDDAYIAAQHLNGKGMKGVFFITTDKIGTEGYLDWRQVKKMRSWGMEIASQGVNGANLLSAGEFYREDEIQRSKKIIEEQLGEAIISYAYADGGYNKSIADTVKEAGYVFARTSESGSRYSNKQLYWIPTLRVFFPAGANQFRAWLGE